MSKETMPYDVVVAIETFVRQRINETSEIRDDMASQGNDNVIDKAHLIGKHSAYLEVLGELLQQEIKMAQTLTKQVEDLKHGQDRRNMALE
jgi:hypothetical protein